MWAGASDAAAESVWSDTMPVWGGRASCSYALTGTFQLIHHRRIWTSGPESGLNFYNGASPSGTTVSGTNPHVVGSDWCVLVTWKVCPRAVLLLSCSCVRAALDSVYVFQKVGMRTGIRVNQTVSERLCLRPVVPAFFLHLRVRCASSLRSLHSFCRLAAAGCCTAGGTGENCLQHTSTWK